jgi:hypothetical protein
MAAGKSRALADRRYRQPWLDTVLGACAGQAMAAGIWHNNKVGAPVTRSLVAYDH